MHQLQTQTVCHLCGDTHQGFLTDWGFRMPDDVWALDANHRLMEVQANEDLCRYGDRFFIRCVLALPFQHSDETFGWGLWVETNQEAFERYIAVYDCDGSHESPARGFIANRIPGYQDVLGCAVDIQFGVASKRPTVRLPVDSALALAVEQHRGIDQPRYHEILAEVGFLRSRRLH